MKKSKFDEWMDGSTEHRGCRRHWFNEYSVELARESFYAGMEQAARLCEARFMGDMNREDMEAKRCASVIRGMIELESHSP